MNLYENAMGRRNVRGIKDLFIVPEYNSENTWNVYSANGYEGYTGTLKECRNYILKNGKRMVK